MNSAKANRTLIISALALFWCLSLFSAEYIVDYKLPVDHPSTVGELLNSYPTHFLQTTNTFERVTSSRSRYNDSNSGLTVKTACLSKNQLVVAESSFHEWKTSAIHTTNLKKILYPFHEFI